MTRSRAVALGLWLVACGDGDDRASTPDASSGLACECASSQDCVHGVTLTNAGESLGGVVDAQCASADRLAAWSCMCQDAAQVPLRSCDAEQQACVGTCDGDGQAFIDCLCNCAAAQAACDDAVCAVGDCWVRVRQYEFATWRMQFYPELINGCF